MSYSYPGSSFVPKDPKPQYGNWKEVPISEPKDISPLTTPDQKKVSNFKQSPYMYHEIEDTNKNICCCVIC